MLFDILGGGDIRDIIISLLLTLPIILIALSFHEAAHAFVAYKMGDRTAYNLGRVTLNPIKHLDIMGAIWMLIFGFGWAKPVPINARNFKNPKRGMAFTAIAGPMANLLLGVFGTVLYSVVIFFFSAKFASISQNQFVFNVFVMLMNFFYLFGMMNFILMFFNLIPIPPFDGSRFFSLFLPTRWYFAIMKYERYTMIAVIAISFLCVRLFNISPVSFVAEKLFDLISNPIITALSNIYFG